MPAVTLTKTYNDGEILTEADLDNIRLGVEQALNDDKLNSDNIQDGGIATAKLADGAVTTVKIADSNITTAKLADDAVTKAKLNSDVVDGSTLEQAEGGELQVKDGGVSQAKLAAKTVTTDGSDPGTGGVSSRVLTDGTPTLTTTFADLSGAVVNLTTTGRPVMITFCGAGTTGTTGANPNGTFKEAAGNCPFNLRFRVKTSGVDAYYGATGYNVTATTGGTVYGSVPASAFNTVLILPAGSHEIALQASTFNGASYPNPLNVTSVKMTVFEI